jgi:hypothetical protein
VSTKITGSFTCAAKKINNTKVRPATKELVKVKSGEHIYMRFHNNFYVHPVADGAR